MRNKVRALLVCAGGLLCAALPAQAAFHLWVINEIFTDSTGNVQFIEMSCSFVGQQFLGGHTITCTDGVTPHTFTFSVNSGTPTTNKRLLIATAGFGALPGGVAPDYILPANFLYKNGGTLNFGPAAQIITYPALSTNGVTATQITGTSTFTQATNSPTNFAGQSGSVNVPPPACFGDITGDRSRDTADLTALLGAFGTCQGSPTYNAAADLVPNNCIDTADLTTLLGLFGQPCP